MFSMSNLWQQYTGAQIYKTETQLGAAVFLHTASLMATVGL